MGVAKSDEQLLWVWLIDEQLLWVWLVLGIKCYQVGKSEEYRKAERRKHLANGIP